MRKLSDNYYFIFILGMIAWYASMLPAIKSEIRDNKTYTDWHSMILYVPYFYGLVNVIIFYLINTYLPALSNYYFVGFVMAFFYSGLGRISGHAEMYKLSNINMLHVYAVLLYVPLYGIVFSWLDDKLTSC